MAHEQVSGSSTAKVSIAGNEKRTPRMVASVRTGLASIDGLRLLSGRVEVLVSELERRSIAGEGGGLCTSSSGLNVGARSTIA